MSKKQNKLKSIFVRQSGSNKPMGVMIAGMRHFPCALGRSGLTHMKREGDGATPVGRFPILRGYYRSDREHICASGIEFERITLDQGWCDAPGDRNYNRSVKLPYPGSHEKMWREDNLYDFCLVLDQNYSKRMRGLGSAIFFHIATNDYRSTEGCVAVKLSDMRWLLAHIGTDTKLIIEG